MKKLLCCTLVTIMIFGFSVTAVAQEEKQQMFSEMDAEFVSMVLEEPELALNRYSNISDITNVPVPANFQEKIVGSLISEYGEVTNLDCEISLVRIQMKNQPYTLLANGQEQGDVMYVLSASTKESPGSLTEDGVTLNGTIGWIDHFGTSNEFKYVSGSRSGSYVGAGRYGSGGRGVAYNGGTDFDSSFSDSTGSGNQSSWFYLHVYSTTQTGKRITLNVSTSILD